MSRFYYSYKRYVVFKEYVKQLRYSKLLLRTEMAMLKDFSPSRKWKHPSRMNSFKFVFITLLKKS